MTSAPAGTSRLYETIFIAPPTLSEADVEKLIGDVSDTLVSRGAEVRLVEKWGRRRLAHLVGRHGEGWFVMLHVAGSGEAIGEAERRMRISDNVLKYLSVRIDDVPGAVEAGVQRLARRARQEEERVQRAADRAQEDARAAKDEATSRRADRDDDDDDGDDNDSDND